MGLVVASIHEKREEFRHELQQAGGGTRPGGETTGVRRKH
jgi:monovalent cation:H+ antiporter-2, CPA2 family